MAQRTILVFFLLLASVIRSEASLSSCRQQSPEISNDPIYLNEPCEKNWNLFADLLYWHMGEVGTLPNSTIAVTASDDIITTALNLNNFNFGWDFGYRVGGRYSDIGLNQWGISLTYTWYRTETKKSGSYPGYVGIPTAFQLTSTLTDSDFLSLFWLFAAKSYEARWDLLYNIFDLEVDHEYSASKALSFRPYLGIRGGWIYQDIGVHSTYVDPLADDTAVLSREKLQNHFWGAGPRCGLSSQWWLGCVKRHSFYLFGDFSTSFLWGHWTLSDFLVLGTTVAANLNMKSRYAGSFMLQDLLGLEWSFKLNSQGASISLRCGYEAQFWFDNLQIFLAYNGRQHNALTLQGGTFDLRCNF